MMYAEQYTPSADDDVVQLRGVVEDLYNRCFSYSGPPVIWEMMVEGPRGTGKSRGILQVIYALCLAFPGIKVLLCRSKRHTMSGTTLPLFEQCMLVDEPAKQGPKPEGRSVYRFDNSSEAWCVSLDERERIRGFTVDIVYYEEGTESDTPDGWETLHGTLRSWKMPFQLLITSTNPKQPGHWLNIRAKDGKIERLKSRFQDNPVLFDDAGNETPYGAAFLAGLRRLTGHRYKRDYLGLWSAAEGTVFDEYDPEFHLIEATIDRTRTPHTLIVPAWNKKFRIDWYALSMDFGYRASGSLGIWAVNDDESKKFRIASVYQPGKQIDWWASVINHFKKDFPMDWGVADAAEPRSIDFLNDRCGDYRHRKDNPFIRPADKAKGKLWGLDQLRWGFSKASGGPRTFLVKDTNWHQPSSIPEDQFQLVRGVYPELRDLGKPACLEDELPNYVWRTPTGEKLIEKDEPDPSCADHAIDDATYFHVMTWMMSNSIKPDHTIFKPDTMGFWLGDYETLGWNWGQPDA